MAAPIYSNIIDALFNQLDLLLNSYVFNSYSALANHLPYPLGLTVIVFISILGLSISQGWVKLSMSNFIKSAIKIGLIYTFAMNWGNFSEWVVHGTQDSAGQIGDWLLQATPMKISSGNGGVNDALQLVMTEFVKMGQWVIDQGSWHALSPILIGIVIWFFGCALILVALFEIVLAKVMLAILFAVAPLFICFTLFKQTHMFFDRWLGAIAGFIFLLIFISSILALVLSMVQWGIQDLYGQQMQPFSTTVYIPILVVSVLGVGLVLKVAQLAQAIGGTITTAAGSELLAGTIGGFIGGSMSKKVGRTGKAVVTTIASATGAVGLAAFNRGTQMVNAISKRLQKGGD